MSYSIELRRACPGLRFSEHMTDAWRVPARLERIVSKRLGSRYRSGRSKDWLKFNNPEAPAVKREAEDYWGTR